jgi:hypothetical protein
VIKSRHGDIELEMTSKHGFSDVATLRALISPPGDPKQIGTDVAFKGISDGDMVAAKRFFLTFSSEKILDSTGIDESRRRFREFPI